MKVIAPLAEQWELEHLDSEPGDFQHWEEIAVAIQVLGLLRRKKWASPRSSSSSSECLRACGRPLKNIWSARLLAAVFHCLRQRAVDPPLMQLCQEVLDQTSSLCKNILSLLSPRLSVFQAIGSNKSFLFCGAASPFLASTKSTPSARRQRQSLAAWAGCLFWQVGAWPQRKLTRTFEPNDKFI